DDTVDDPAQINAGTPGRGGRVMLAQDRLQPLPKLVWNLPDRLQRLGCVVLCSRHSRLPSLQRQRRPVRPKRRQTPFEIVTKDFPRAGSVMDGPAHDERMHLGLLAGRSWSGETTPAPLAERTVA